MMTKYCYDRAIAGLEYFFLPFAMLGGVLTYITMWLPLEDALNLLNGKDPTPASMPQVIFDVGFAAYMAVDVYFAYSKYQYCWDCMKSYKMTYGAIMLLDLLSVAFFYTSLQLRTRRLL